MARLKDCPNCGETNRKWFFVEINPIDGLDRVMCVACKFRGPSSEIPKQAERLWNLLRRT